jgi:ABC-type nitrate/sulfonate/bicarbonate transport system substrate-binding protein
MSLSMPSRRGFVVGLTALGCSLSYSRRSMAAALETTSFEMLAVEDPNVGAQAAIAEAKGYFSDEGLSATLHWVQSTGDVLTIMASGTQSLTTGGSQTEVILRAQNFPIKMIAAYCDSADAQGLVLRPGLKLSSPKELEGKTLAFTEGTAPILILTGLARRFGFDARKVKIQNMNQSEGIVATARGDVDGFLGFQPNLYRTVQLGGTMYATGTTLYVNDGKPERLTGAERLYLSASGILASEDLIKTKPNTLKAVLRALIRATDLLNSDRPAALAAMATRFKVGVDVLDAASKSNVYDVQIGRDSVAALNFTSDWSYEQHRISRKVSPAEAFDTNLLSQVDPRRVTWTPSSL